MAKNYKSTLDLMESSAIAGAREAFDFAPHATINDKISTRIFDFTCEASKNLELKE